MAAAKRIVQISRRALSALSPVPDHSPSLLVKEPVRQLSPLSSIFTRQDFCRRAFQTQAEKGVEGSTGGSLKGNNDVASCSSEAYNNDASSSKSSLTSNLKVSPRHDLAIIYTCKVCETRSIKTICRESYHKGVVVVRCGGCDNLHLIADRLGWFGAPESIEELLASRGEEVKKGSVDTLNLTLEDIAGKEVLKE